MVVKASDVEALRQLPSSGAADGPSVFDTLAEVLAYVVEIARTENYNESDCVELICRSIDCNEDELLRDEAILRPLGYRAVADRLRKLARRAPEGPLTFEKRWPDKVRRHH